MALARRLSAAARSAAFWLALATVLVSAAVLVSGDLPGIAFGAGFVPARIGGTPLPAEWFQLPVWLTPLSAALLHGGFTHLAVNLVTLIFGARIVERALGRGAMLTVYIAGAYAAAAGQWIDAWWLPDGDPMTPAVGASGAISALLGAYVSLFARQRAQAIGPLPAEAVEALWQFASWTAINFGWAWGLRGSGFAVAWAMHAGGFAAGYLLARPLLRRRVRAGAFGAV